MSIFPQHVVAFIGFTSLFAHFILVATSADLTLKLYFVDGIWTRMVCEYPWEACYLVDEANMITREVRPQELEKWFTNLAKKKHQEVSSVWSWPSIFLQISLWFTHWAIGFCLFDWCEIIGRSNFDFKVGEVDLRHRHENPPTKGAPTIWIGVGLGHFPSPRGCSDDAWASSCVFFQGCGGICCSQNWQWEVLKNTGCWHWSHMLWLRIRLMSLNGADPSGQAGGGPWDSIRHRRMMKDVLALQNGISYIYISYLQILYFYIIIIISLLDLILRHWGWWITVFPQSSTILLRCAFCGKGFYGDFWSLVVYHWDVGVSNVIQLVTFWWLDDFIPSSQLENMKCTWLKFLGSWVRIPEICLWILHQTLVLSTYVNSIKNHFEKSTTDLPRSLEAKWFTCVMCIMGTSSEGYPTTMGFSYSKWSYWGVWRVPPFKETPKYIYI